VKFIEPISIKARKYGDFVSSKTWYKYILILKKSNKVKRSH